MRLPEDARTIRNILAMHAQNSAAGTESAENWDRDWYPLPLTKRAGTFDGVVSWCQC